MTVLGRPDPFTSLFILYLYSARKIAVFSPGNCEKNSGMTARKIAVLTARNINAIFSIMKARWFQWEGITILIRRWRVS